MSDGRIGNDAAMTVAEWVDRYYRPDRLKAESGRRERIIADRERDLRETGEAFISQHDSVTGTRLVLYNPAWRPEGYIRWCATYTDENEKARNP